MRDIRNNSDLGREEIREFNEKVPEGFENLIYLKIASGCAVYNYDSVIFKNLQISSIYLDYKFIFDKVKFSSLKSFVNYTSMS